MWIYLTHPSRTEPAGSFWNREAKLERRLGELSLYHIARLRVTTLWRCTMFTDV